MSEITPVPEVTSDLRRNALVALTLLVVGVTMLTLGIALAFGVPAALIVLGLVVFGGGVVLGLMS